MNFSHVRRLTVTTGSLAVANTFSTRPTVYRRTTNVIWLSIASMEAMNPTAVS